jgi:hypothetical protein
VARIAGSHPAGPGSIPGGGILFFQFLFLFAGLILLFIVPESPYHLMSYYKDEKLARYFFRNHFHILDFRNKNQINFSEKVYLGFTMMTMRLSNNRCLKYRTILSPTRYF